MATRTVILRDTVPSASSLTLKLFARGTGSSGTAAGTYTSTVSNGDLHTWTISGLTAGSYDFLLLLGGSTRTGQGVYVHRDTAETVYLPDTDPVSDSILTRLTSAIYDTLVALDAMISGGRFTSYALSLGPGGGAGGGTVAIDDIQILLGDGITVVPDCDVIFTTTSDSPYVNVHAEVRTTASGMVPEVLFDAGTYYMWRQKTGYQFTDPLTVVVDADGSYTIT